MNLAKIAGVAVGLSVLVVALFCAEATFAQTYEPPDPSKIEPTSYIDSYCGPYCLYIVCKMLDHPATLEKLFDLTGVTKETGTTMSALKRAAEQKGLYAVGLTVRRSEFPELKGLGIGIGHIEKRVKGKEIGHFFVISSIDGNSVQIIDPPHVAIVPVDRLFHRWDGKVLMISDKESIIASIKPRRIVGTFYLLALGIVIILAAVFVKHLSFSGILRRRKDEIEPH